MDMRRIAALLVGALIAVAAAGCNKSEPGPSTPAVPATALKAAAPTASLGEPVLRLHWLGKRRLAADTNAAGLMRVWDLPASTNLEAQTLEKIALAPWRVLRGPSNQVSAITHPPSPNPFRPLADDLLQEESFLEVRAVTNQPAQVVLAIKLSDDRARLWRTNLAATLESLTQIKAVPAANGRIWALKKHHAPNLLEFARAGDWTLFGAAMDTNALLGDVLVRLKAQPAAAPFTSQATNAWATTELDLAWLAKSLGVPWSLSAGWPRYSETDSADGENVRTRAELNFPKPLDLDLEPWNIPTNLVQEPLLSFTAIRGLGPRLAEKKAWTDLQVGAPPNQFFLWSLQGIPLQTYFAAPMPNASNLVHKLGEMVMQKANPLLETNNLGRIGWTDDTNGFIWTGAPIMGPWLKSIQTNGGTFLFGGLFPPGGTNAAPADMLQTVQAWSNLVYYDWEITGPRIDSLNFILQVFRLAAQKPQFPPESASMLWFNTLQTNLGNSVTAVIRTSPTQLTLVRQSGIGATAFEIHFLGDWLESPDFPFGLHTFTAQPPPKPGLP